MGLFGNIFKGGSTSEGFEDEYDEDFEEEESLSVYDAADIWLSNGMDEDYMFGYSEEELKRALK